MRRAELLAWTLLVACSTPAAEAPSARECASCHLEDYQRADPPHPGVRPDTCGVCHTRESWHPDVLRHEWPLTGAHLTTGCFDCHGGAPPVFDGTPTECIGCHADDEATRTFPAHHGFGTACASCHDTTTFRPATHRPEPPDAGPPDAAPPPPPPTTHVVRPRHPTTRPHAPRPTTTAPPPTTRDPTPPDTTTRASPRW